MTKSELKILIQECINEYELDSISESINSINNEINEFNTIMNAVNESSILSEAIDKDKLKEKAGNAKDKIIGAIKKVIEKVKNFITVTIPNFFNMVFAKSNLDDVSIPGLTITREQGTKQFDDACKGIDWITTNILNNKDGYNNKITSFEFDGSKKNVYNRNRLQIELNKGINELNAGIKILEGKAKILAGSGDLEDHINANLSNFNTTLKICNKLLGIIEQQLDFKKNNSEQSNSEQN